MTFFVHLLNQQNKKESNDIKLNQNNKIQIKRSEFEKVIKVSVCSKNIFLKYYPLAIIELKTNIDDFLDNTDLQKDVLPIHIQREILYMTRNISSKSKNFERVVLSIYDDSTLSISNFDLAIHNPISDYKYSYQKQDDSFYLKVQEN